MNLPLGSLFETAGLVAFGLSGGILAYRKGMDLYGLALLGLLTGTGGGVIRDVLAGHLPPDLLRSWGPAAISAGAGLAGGLFPAWFERRAGGIAMLDAVGLGIFTATGAARAVASGMGLLGALVLGVAAGSGGGMLRDLLAGEIPFVLRREVYATAALAGAALDWGWRRGGLPVEGAEPASALLVFLVRWGAIRWGLKLPVPGSRSGRGSATGSPRGSPRRPSGRPRR